MANKNSRTKNSALSLLTGLGGQLLNELLRFVTRTVFIMTLGKMFLGINGLFSEVMNMLALANLGVGTAIIYRLYKPIAVGDDHQVRVLLKFYKNAYRVIGVVILVLGLCLLPFLHYLIKDYGRLGEIGLNAELVYILFLGQSVVSYFFFAYRTCIFAADQKMYVTNTVNIITSILTAITQIVILVIWHDFIAYLVIGILYGIISNLVIALLAYKQYPEIFKVKERDKLSKNEVSSMFKDCGALLVYRLSIVVNKSTGNLILSTFIGLAVVGLYSNYLLLYAAVTTLIKQIQQSVQSSLGNLYATASAESKYHFFNVTNFVTMLISGTVAVCLGLFMDDLISLWIGDDYVIAQPFSLIVALEVLTYGMQSNLGQIRNVSGLFKQMWMRPIFSTLATLVFTLILVKHIGVYAVPLGILVGRLVIFTADPIIIFRKCFNGCSSAHSYYFRHLLYLFVLSLIALGLNYFCRIVVPVNGWFSLVVCFCICSIVTPVLFCLVFIRSVECKYLSEKLIPIIRNVIHH